MVSSLQVAKRTPSKPKVGMPLATDFNECVALDLRGPIDNKKYILYFVDCFTRLTRGVLIRDKTPATIVKAIINFWIIGKGLGPGMPGKFLYDNGTEFNNPQMIDLCEKIQLLFLLLPQHMFLTVMGYVKEIMPLCMYLLKNLSLKTLICLIRMHLNMH